MPITRIDLRKGKDAEYRRKVGQAVYEATVACANVPKNDHFQIIGEHDAGNFAYDPNYLDVHRTDDLIMIQIVFNEGRTLEQKRALYKALAHGLHEAVGIRPEDVLINLIEVNKANWSFGNGIAQYVS